MKAIQMYRQKGGVFLTALLLVSLLFSFSSCSGGTNYVGTSGGTSGGTSYTVTFETNGGSAVDPQTVAAGETAKKPEDPKKASCDFGGWYADSALTSLFSFATKIVKDTTLYAKWIDASVPTYKVEIVLSEHCKSMTATPSASVAEGTEVTLEIEPEADYKLDALTVKDGGNNAVSTTEVTAGAKYTFKMPAGDVKVSAKFKATGPFGSKTSPDAVGDIMFSDGSAVPYTADLTDAQKQAAVAVIFDATKKLGVGLKQGTGLAWAKSGTTGFSTKFSTSETDGSGNWEVIKAADSTGAAVAETNYPAFNFANTYGVSVAGEESGWYLPAKDELMNLRDSYRAGGSAVKEALDKCTGTIDLSIGYYWSSSQYKTVIDGAWFVSFGPGNVYGDDYKTMKYAVCAVRAFN